MRHYSKKYEHLVPQIREYCKDNNNQIKPLRLIGEHFGISADEASSIIRLNNIPYIGGKSRIINLSESDKNDIHKKYLIKNT